MKNRDRRDLNGFSKHHLGDGRTLMVFLNLVTFREVRCAEQLRCTTIGWPLCSGSFAELPLMA